EARHAVAAMRRAQSDPEFGARHFRSVLDRVAVVLRVAMLEDAGEEIAAQHVRHGRVLGTPAASEGDYAARVDALAH
ncbi:MAG TPA: hypothetical protein VGI86_20070, partial [Acidimicrobiia bacterium]